MDKEEINRRLKEIKAWVKLNLSKPIPNLETGFLIEVSNKGIEHTLGHDLFEDKSGRFIDLIAVIKKLETILKHAKLVESRQRGDDFKNRIIAHEFTYDLISKGKSETLQIIVREFIEGKKVIINKKIFYNHRFLVEEIKKP